MAVAGCGGVSDQPDLGQVTGTVTLDGAGLADAEIRFSPDSGGASSSAVADESGRYELTYLRDIMGAKVGKHTVKVSTYVPADTDDDGKVSGGTPEKLPARYNVNSELSFEVEAGANTIDLELTSDGEIIQPDEEE